MANELQKLGDKWLINTDEHLNKYSFRQAIVNLNIKNKKIARAYYFMIMIGEIIERYGNN